MQINSDYEEMFKTLNAHQIKYVVVGAYAVIYHTEPRYTKDLDIWILPALNDTKKIVQALAEYGAPLTEITPDTFKNKNIIYQIGVAPVRIDILTDIPGLTFDEAWKNRKEMMYGNTPIYVLGVEDVIKSKQASGRPQDLVDVGVIQKFIKKTEKK